MCACGHLTFLLINLTPSPVSNRIMNNPFKQTDNVGGGLMAQNRTQHTFPVTFPMEHTFPAENRTNFGASHRECNLLHNHTHTHKYSSDPKRYRPRVCGCVPAVAVPSYLHEGDKDDNLQCFMPPPLLGAPRCVSMCAWFSAD